MDQMQFDSLARRLGKRINRRTGVLGAIGAMLGLATAPDADAARKATRRHEKLACRNANSQCLSDDECCSGSCVPKPGGTGFRCAKRHAKKKNDRPEKTKCTVCASGCPYSTIEEAVADAAPGDIVTVGPGTYIPANGYGDTYGAIRLTQDITIKACDPDNPPTITGSIDTQSLFLIAIGELDNQASCTTEQPTVVFDGINFAGDPDLLFSAILVICNATWTLRNADVSYFRFSAIGSYPALTAFSGNGMIDSSSIHNNNADGGAGSSAILLYPLTLQGPPMLSIRDTIIANNQAFYGAIALYNSGQLVLTGSTSIRDNSSVQDGGGIFIGDDGATVGPQTSLTIVDDVTITGNTSQARGGGIATSPETLVTGATTQTVFGNNAAECLNYFQDPTCILN